MYNHNFGVRCPSRSNFIYVILLTVGFIGAESSAVWSERGDILKRGSFSLETSASLIIPEHKQPLSTKACTMFISLINAFTEKDVVFILISWLTTAFCSWARLCSGASSFPKPIYSDSYLYHPYLPHRKYLGSMAQYLQYSPYPFYLDWGLLRVKFCRP